MKAQAPTPAECSPLVELFNAGRHVELESQARLLVEQYRDSGFAWKVLGLSLMMQGKEALPALQKATELLPEDAETHYNLGVALQDRGDPGAAVRSYRRALALQPNHVEAVYNLGNALQLLGLLDEAISLYRQALALRPDYAEAHCNLGNALQAQGRLDEAIASYRQALAINPHAAETYSSLGNALKAQNLLEEAIDNYRQAIALKPDLAVAYCNLGNTFADQDNAGEAIRCYRQALACQPNYAEAHSNLLYTLNYAGNFARETCLHEAREYGRNVAGQVQLRYSGWSCRRNPGRLRIGLVSGDLCNHPVGYFLESLLAAIDPSRIELIAYPTDHRQDELTDRLRPSLAGWKPLTGLNDAAASRLIHDDGVHILIDLAGHTARNRLPIFAARPAPVQVSWLGYFATTGLAEMDYLLADAHVAPPDEESDFTEKIWRLPDSYLCFSPPAFPLAVSPLPALAGGQLTFGSFNNLAKINDKVIALWARVMHAVPDSRLFLKTKLLGHAPTCAALRQRFAAQGIAADRLWLEGAAPRGELLAAYRRVDIGLDPFPYPGGTTSAESLWMGVPVVTRGGDRFLAHVGETIAHSAGLSDWIAMDDDAYVAKAVAEAGNLARLAQLRAGLRSRVLASPLFDARRFARNFETALREMWLIWQETAP